MSIEFDCISIRCPHCPSSLSYVRETRSHSGVVYRRRVCKGCGVKYTTTESILTLDGIQAAVINHGIKSDE